MAYKAEHRRYFARELARSGGNISAAAQSLREDYEDLREVSDRTLRRYLKEPGVAELIAEEAKRFAQIAVEESVLAERERVREALRGSEMDRLAHDGKILDDVRDLVSKSLQEALAQKDAAKLPAQQIAHLYERLVRIHDQRRERLLPAVGESKDVSTLLNIIAEEALAMFGKQANKLMLRSRERYLKSIAAKPEVASIDK